MSGASIAYLFSHGFLCYILCTVLLFRSVLLKIHIILIYDTVLKYLKSSQYYENPENVN